MQSCRICWSRVRNSPPKGQPDPTMMSHVMPRSRHASTAVRTMRIHSSLSHGSAARPSVSVRSGKPMVLISTPPIPAACSTSSSRTISPASTRLPFHHHRTKGL